MLQLQHKHIAPMHQYLPFSLTLFNLFLNVILFTQLKRLALFTQSFVSKSQQQKFRIEHDDHIAHVDVKKDEEDMSFPHMGNGIFGNICFLFYFIALRRNKTNRFSQFGADL